MLCSFDHPLEGLPVLGSAVTIPDCDGAGEDALDRTPVEVAEYFG